MVRDMKTISLLLGFCIVVISACMIYLVRSGISLRSAPLIRPSVMSADRHNVAKGLVTRLFPELQNAHYILWGVLPENEESQKVLSFFAEEYDQTFKTPVHILRNAEAASDEELKSCEKPCVLMLERTRANELTANEFIEKRLRPLNRDHINITWVPFTAATEAPPQCEHEKRLTLDCLVPLSVQEVQKKLKDPQQLYFFLRKYNERDYFLFIQQPLMK